MITLLSDANIQGHVDQLVRRMQGEEWRDFSEYLKLAYLRFEDVGLNNADSDAIVWNRCQELQLFLITNNRNDDGPDSLEATIRASCTSQSLPVFTIGDAEKVRTNAAYADEVIDRLFRYLLELDNIRGIGRLYIP